VSNSVHGELISYFADCKTYAQNNGLDFSNVNDIKYCLLAPLAQDLLSAPAFTAFAKCLFSVCRELTAGKRNLLTTGLETRILLTVNMKCYQPSI